MARQPFDSYLMPSENIGVTAALPAVSKTALGILVALSLSHLLNDTMQSLIPAMYPLLKGSLHLSFGQIGLITLTNQLTASLLQPLIGWYTDRRPLPFSLPFGMGATLLGLLLLSLAASLGMILIAVALIGIGSSFFHPEASRVARTASGGRHGFAQSLFQVGGNAGSSLGPLLTAWLIVPGGQTDVGWFSLLALVGIVLLYRVGIWYRSHLHRLIGQKKTVHASSGLSRPQVIRALVVLIGLVLSKYFYLASMTSYYTFFLITQFHLGVQQSQVYLFIFLLAVAVGTIVGGPLGDRFGRKWIIWISILGTAPFSLLLPHVGLFWVAGLSIFIGLILASAFSAIVVYAQELMPGRVGMISGLFFGLAFGLGGIGSALMGKLADHTSLYFVFELCSFLPLLGLLTAFLPNLDRQREPVISELSDDPLTPGLSEA